MCVCVCIVLSHKLRYILLGTEFFFFFFRLRRVLGGASSFDEQEHKEAKTQTRWAKLTYVGRQTKFTTKLFKNSNLKVSFKTENTVGNLLTQNRNINPNKFNKCGVRLLTCHDCNRKYIGQTDRPFRIRFLEHFRDLKYGNVKSKCAQHNLGNKHSIGSMEDIVEILYITRKGDIMNTPDRFHMYNEATLDNQINDKCTVKYKVIFDTVIHKNSHRGHSPLRLLIPAWNLFSH